MSNAWQRIGIEASAVNASGKSVPCECTCGATTFSASESPLFRLFCHCSICQRFNDAPFADVTVFRANDVAMPPEGVVQFGTYRPPPNVRRGVCAECASPAIEVFHTPLFPKLTIVPTQNIKRTDILPAPAAHIFYESRVSDAADDLIKHHGYWRSQLAFGRLLLKALARGQKAG